MNRRDAACESLRHLDAVEVVHRQDGAPLVLVADEAETFGLPRLLVAHQVDVYDLSIPDRFFLGGERESEFLCSLTTAARKASNITAVC